MHVLCVCMRVRILQVIAHISYVDSDATAAPLSRCFAVVVRSVSSDAGVGVDSDVFDIS